MTFRTSTSQETASRFRASYARRGVVADQGRVDAGVLREVMVAYVGSVPRMPRLIFAHVRATCGEVSDRRLWRALRQTKATGRLAWTSTGYIRGAT